jgi:hypothetical protein
LPSLKQAHDVEVHYNYSLPRFEKLTWGDPYVVPYDHAVWEARRPRPRQATFCKPAPRVRTVRPSRTARRRTRTRVLTTSSPSRGDPDDGDPDPDHVEGFTHIGQILRNFLRERGVDR